MRPSVSIGMRLVVATLATTMFTLVCLVALVAYRADQSLRSQAIEVSRWSDAQLSERLLSDVRIAQAQLQAMREDVQRRFATVARRADVSEAVQSANTVAIVEILRPALALADVDGAVVLDVKLRPVGADRLDADLLQIPAALNRTALPAALAALVAAKGPTTDVYETSLFADPVLGQALAAPGLAGLVDVFAMPIVDEFADVTAVIIGYRRLKAVEPTLADFARLSGRDVVVLGGGQVVSAAFRNLGQPDGTHENSALLSFEHGASAGRCIPYVGVARICAAAPRSELVHLTDQVVGLGEGHIRSLLATLAVAALGAILLFAAVSTLLSRQITRPLRRITDVVMEVAAGNWRMPVQGSERRDEVGNIARALVVLEDSLEERDRLREDAVIQNTKLLERKRELRDQNARFDAALNNMSQGLCMFDAQGRLTVWNARLAEIYGLPPTAFEAGFDIAALRKPLQIPDDWALPIQPARILPAVATQTRVLADARIIEVVTQPMLHGGWVETHEDVTEQRLAEARITQMAMFDGLTGLANRSSFNEHLAGAVAARRDGASPASVVCLDLDDFKGVNDSLGHGAGDELLRQCAERMRDALAPGGVAARLGGDEFAILLPLAMAEAQDWAVAVLAQLKQPYLVDGKVVISDASIGIAEATDEAARAETVLRNADLALYTAKAEGRGRICLFDPVMEERLRHRRWLEDELRRALREGEIAVHYQPLIELGGMQVCGFEALARWFHPERGPISPGDFVPVAEEAGLIDSLGEYVLRQACRDAAAWPAHVRVAVNVSPLQFRNENLCVIVASALANSGLSSRRLELEVTESVVLADDADVFAKLHQLRKLGVRFSMDDFGTGYSSLSSLRAFPFDKIKLDRSFLRDSLTRADCATIVRIVGDLGGSLSMTTLAEGVETAEQLQFLCDNGFREAQGFLFAPALPAAEALAYLEGPPARRAA